MRLLLLLLLAGCVADPQALFEAEAVPVLEASCAASTCHGVAPGAEEAGEHIDRDRWYLDLDAEGSLADPVAARAASLARVDTTAPITSSLLRKPLSAPWGGVPHAGGDNLLRPDAPEVQALLRWIDSEEAGGEDPLPLDVHEQAFADTVQPLLFDLTCATGGCHGVQASIPFRLDGGVDGVVGPAITRHNLEIVESMLSPSGDPMQARLLRKSLPLHAGGILHKGGNDRFLSGPEDPRVAAIVEWACGLRSCDDGAVDGLVYRRGPAEPEDPFTVDVFVPGSDLWFAPWEGDSLGPPTNLTAGLHDAPADLRDPALSPDGGTLVFAMRRAGDGGHRIWRMDLASGAAEPLTEPGQGSDRDPAYASDGSIWFVSTREGLMASDGLHLDADLFRLDPDTGAVTRRSWTLQVERTPRYLTTGHENGGEIAFTTLRDAIPAAAVGHPFRFPPDLSTEYHQHFGATGPTDLLFDMQELPDGRYVLTAGSLGNAWPLGDLAILDRNFGPAIDAADPTPPALPVYADPLVLLDPRAEPSGSTWTGWRDPAPLPDGRLVAAAADGPFDLGDPEAAVRTSLRIVELSEDPRGSGPTIGATWTLLEDADASLSEPVPVVRRHGGPPAGDPPEPTGRATLVHQGLPYIDGILGALPPAGIRAPQHDFVAARVIEALPATPEQRAPVADGTTTGKPAFAPARILGEVPLEADGSFQIDVPAGISLRIQGLDADGFARGTPHNRWFDFADGQVIKQGLPAEGPDVYSTRCAGCHGAADGEPDHTFAPPDAISSATFTLARFEGRDPRRPRDPVRLDDDTAQEIDFEADVAPILAGCPACHDAAPLDLRDTPEGAWTAAYASLLRTEEPLVDASSGQAWRSRLLEVVTGRELGAPGAPMDGPHPEAAPLSDADVATLIRWVDLGAAFRGTP